MGTAFSLTQGFVLGMGERWQSWIAGRREASPGRRFHHECVLGTSLELHVHAARGSSACRAEQAVLAEIERLEKIFSSYDADSELRRWLATAETPVALSAELRGVLEAAATWQGRTGGVFHPAAEELTRLWKRCAAEGRAPTPAERESTLARMNGVRWELDPTTGSGTRYGDAPITLNAIAKGYIVDRACERALDTAGVEQVLVNIGGDLRIAGPQERIVGIADPRCDAENGAPLARVRVSQGAVATSGGYRRGFRIGSRWYSHLFDPRTGLPVEHTESVSVVAPTAMVADVLATVFSVLPPDQSLALADGLPEAACLLVTADGNLHRSRRWVELEIR